MEDQIVHSFLFTITPLEITSSSKSIKVNQKKSILIKLGTRTEKTNVLNQPLKIQIDVLYSHTLKKYCPVKGIIKIYDIGSDGNQVISSVGGFQTEEFLNQGKCDVTLERDVGTSKLKMKLHIENLGEVSRNSKNNENNPPPQQRQNQLNSGITTTAQANNNNKSRILINPTSRFSATESTSRGRISSSITRNNNSLLHNNQQGSRIVMAPRPLRKDSITDEKEQKTQVQKLTQQLEKKNQQLLMLKGGKDKEKASVWKKLQASEIQCEKYQKKIKVYQNRIRVLEEEKKKMKEKQAQLELVIFNKDNALENYKQENQELRLMYKEMEDTLNNDELVIDQLRQQTANLQETIEGYRSKYGDLKTIKDKALQNQLKQCLMWIDQQTRQIQDHGNSILGQQLTQASRSHNVSQIIKNLQFQGASRQQMFSIKQQLSGLIQRIDNFLVK